MKASPSGWIAFVAIVAALAATVAEGAGAPGPPRPAAQGGKEAVATIDVGGAPSSIVASARAVWVSLGLGGIARIDPATNEVVARLRPGGAVVDLASGFGALWAVDVFGDRLLRIDPGTNRVSRRTRVGGMPSGVTVGRGLVWVTSQLGSTVSGVDPATGRVVRLLRFAYGELWPGGLAVTRDGIWVITGAGNELTLVDDARRAVVRRVPLPDARALAVTGRSLWVGLATDAALVRIDADGTARRVTTRGYESDGYGPALAGGKRLLLAAAGRVAVVDPADGSFRRVLRLPAGHRASALAFGRGVWVADETASVILGGRPRTATGRLLASAGGHRFTARLHDATTRTARHVSPRGGRAARHDHRR